MEKSGRSFSGEMVSSDQFSSEHFFYDPKMFVNHCCQQGKYVFSIHNLNPRKTRWLILTTKSVQEEGWETCNDKNNINGNNNGWYLFHDYMPIYIGCRHNGFLPDPGTFELTFCLGDTAHAVPFARMFSPTLPACFSFSKSRSFLTAPIPCLTLVSPFCFLLEICSFPL